MQFFGVLGRGKVQVAYAKITLNVVNSLHRRGRVLGARCRRVRAVQPRGAGLRRHRQLRRHAEWQGAGSGHARGREQSGCRQGRRPMGHGSSSLTARCARRVALVGCSIAVLAGCATQGPAPLYMWETFPRQQYDALLGVGFDPAEQIRLLEAHAEKARGANAALPPGLRAHLGMLHFGAGHVARARELWQAEKLAFPEATAYMDQLLRRLAAPAPSAKSRKPQMKHCGPACLAAVAGLACSAAAPRTRRRTTTRPSRGPGRPSLLVMPPVNESPDIKASPSVWAQATRPLAEAGYYVLPVTLVDETLRQNGVGTADDAQKIPYPKLRDVFGADAAVYIRVSQVRYDLRCAHQRHARGGRGPHRGPSNWRVALGRLCRVDRTGTSGAAEGRRLAGAAGGPRWSHRSSTPSPTRPSIYAGSADAQLLGAPHVNGILPGPRSPLYGQPPAAR